jgi:MoCo/4Fe-4S cofactor protein with predicted Tat translocation signal
MTDLSYWRSLRELHGSTEVDEQKAHEFMAGVTGEFKLSDLSTMSRKQFLALLSASAAFAAAGCTDYRDKGEIIPYTRKPEEIVPGVANFYASTCVGCAQACGILIKTREGRPIKVDGNPDHPVNRGKICAKGQASILTLYDPYRLRSPQHGAGSGRTGEVTWTSADADIVRQLSDAAAAGTEIALVAHATASPTAANLLKEFAARYRTAKVYTYDLFNDAARRRAWMRSYGTDELPVVDWAAANILVALESDFLGTEGLTLEQIREFTNRRDVMKSAAFNRLYSIEGTMSLTGANADHRIRLRPDAQLDLVLALLNEFIVVRRIGRGNQAIGSLIGSASLKKFADAHGVSADLLTRLADDLAVNRGKALVVAGDTLPESVHLAVNYLNEVLGNTALYKKNAANAPVTRTNPEEFAGLVARMKSGRVAVVIHVGSNPVYHLPTSIGYADALRAVPLSISLTEADDETSRLCAYVLPVNHAFESWGDYCVRIGVHSLQQPVIAPLYDTRQKEAVLLAWMAGAGTYRDTLYHEYLMSRWEKTVYPASGAKADFRSFWLSALHDGVVTLPTKTAPRTAFKSDALSSVAVSSSASGFAVSLIESPYLGDGRFANNGWLQELPNPISKVVWDNYAAISPKSANELGVAEGNLVDVNVNGVSVTLPVFLQPGQADNHLSVFLGYGRTNAGPIGTNVGFNALPLLDVQGLTGSRVLLNAVVTKAAGSHAIVSTQEHHALDDEFTKELHLKRKIIREGTLADYAKDPTFIRKDRPELFNIAPGVEYNGVKWAMAIDLNKCIGCNACVAGCNVENNIPVVGKEQAGKGRAMHWIRIDRYYAGTDAAPSLSHQPMLCQHCDNAPCENVCPVVATNHSPDGLNQMVYNRCVGTKYCSNNCPYKVRRFNFFDWRSTTADGYYDEQPVSLVHNPEVTVRSRGVMEKCTFCVQRIMEARQHATEHGRSLKGSDVRTACQEACPATAIVFGDMNDPASTVSAYREHALGYHVLEEVNARPNVTYVAKLRNISA